MLPRIFLFVPRFFSTENNNNAVKKLYKHLLRQCLKLPKGAREHYQFMVKQSFKQHINEPDSERVKQIIQRSYEDCEWVLKKMFQVPLATSSTDFSPREFWNALMLYHDRSHLVNRKLAAVSQASFYQVRFNSNSVKLRDLLNRTAILYEIRKLGELAKENIKKEFVVNLLEAYDKEVHLEELTIDDFRDLSTGIFISVRILFPRTKNCQKAIEVVTLDKENNKVTFLAVSDTEKLYIAPPFSYEIELTSSCTLRINVNSFEDADTSYAEWLMDKLFAKLIKWIENIDENRSNIQSLSLVQVDEYCLTYNKLKSKYGEQLVKEWPKKSGTDPQKYVYEDIAIASYLICLWSDQENVQFVDCGCGNGLLVFLLNQEGYQGYGLDVRRRPIWDIYPQNIKLQVEAVTPNSLFPECTWIIGNHSDELTPWIPVIALKSSPKTNFFVLPCCPYDFNGRKFIRTNTLVSAYSDYLSYIHDVSNKCGFKTDIDKLRIPSTKRTCLVGIRNETEGEKCRQIVQIMTEFVEKKTDNKVVQRSATELVKNCTQLERNLIMRIVRACINKILSGQDYITKLNGDPWNKGGALPMSELIKEISPDDLRQLKKECGGLQTLLRNHRYLFELKDGLAKLRLPISIKETSKYKDKPCWFFKNHPEGCLYDTTNCGYCHE